MENEELVDAPAILHSSFFIPHSSLSKAPKRNDARPTAAVPCGTIRLTGHLILQILPSDAAGVQPRRLKQIRPVSNDEPPLWAAPRSCLLGAYGGEAYDVGQAWQDLVGTTRHLVPPFF